MFTTLIEPAELAAPLARSAGAEGDWTIIDCRFDLARPDWGASAYAAGHVPNALYAHLDHDLSGPVTAASGRHPLPSVERLAETFGRWGIDDTVQVVAYDQGNGAYAARLWWLLRWAGHRKVAVLNGGIAAWQQAGLPTETAPGAREPRVFTPVIGANAVMSTAELERLLGAGALAGETPHAPGTEPLLEKWMLVDARGADRFAGENETIDPVAGHIPGAHNHPFLRNVDAHGRFLAAAELRERWETTLGQRAVGGAASGGAPAEHMIAMCGSGVTACHNLLALEVAGLPGARLYAGSWSEWIREATRPVAKGAR
jgi:thiosulfate/3-mercaptopyruvate sulfurtransferase